MIFKASNQSEIKGRGTYDMVVVMMVVVVEVIVIVRKIMRFN